jgi:repressor LexA
MLNLSARQVTVLRALLRFARENGYMPSLRELARELKVSYATVRQHLDALKARGWVASDGTAHGLCFSPGREPLLRELESRGAASRQGNEEVGVRIPLVGSIVAGQPLEAIEVEGGEIVVPVSMAGTGAYALRVRGTSMVDDHILDGDIVVVVPQARVENGEVVVALLEDGSATLKRIYMNEAPPRPEIVSSRQVRRGRVVGTPMDAAAADDPASWVRLQPANTDMEPMYARNVRVQGRVTGLVRSVR